MSEIQHHEKGESMAAQLYTTGKLAEALGVSAAKVKKLLEELRIKEDAAKGVCKYYGEAALKKLKAAAK
jgi:plasmid maintenance system antidote protein VapI